MSSALLQAFVNYGIAGDVASLEQIALTTPDGDVLPTVNLPLSLAFQIGNRCIHMLAHNATTINREYVWKCLLIMSSDMVNTNATAFLVNFKDSEILTHAVVSLNAVWTEEQRICFNFIILLVDVSEDCLAAVASKTGMLEALIAIVNAAFEPALIPDRYDKLLQTMIILSQLTCRTDFLIEFMRLYKVLQNLGEMCRTAIEIDAQFVHFAGCCALQLMLLFRPMADQYRALRESGYVDTDHVANEEQAVQLVQSWHFVACFLLVAGNEPHLVVLPHLSEVSLLHAVILQSHTADEPGQVDEQQALRVSRVHCRALLFNGGAEVGMLGPSPMSTIQLLVQLVNQYKMATTAIILNCFMDEYPAVRAAVESQVGKVQFCAFPRCPGSNLLRHGLQRCVRCRAVWYCGREHQKEHWPEHKRTCQPCAGPAGAPEETTETAV